MFVKGEYVVCGNKGVCVVDDVTTLNISGIDKERQYYILKPVYMAGSTVYIPVDTAKESMRRILSHEEADRLIESIPQIPRIVIANDKLLEQEYRNLYGRNLTLSRLPEAVVLPLCPDKGNCLRYDPNLSASVYLENDLEQLLRQNW